MNKVSNKLRVEHMAQVPCPVFTVEVADEADAFRIMNLLAEQHNFLFENGIIPDYANVICVSMWSEEDQDWVDYYNEAEEMDWEDFSAEYLQEAEVG